MNLDSNHAFYCLRILKFPEKVYYIKYLLWKIQRSENISEARIMFATHVFVIYQMLCLRLFL